MNKKSFLLILVLINLIVFKGLVIAEYNQESFDKQLEELKNKGILTQELIDALENLSPEQKLVMISSVNPDSEKFWEQWKTDLNGNKKTAFLRGLNEENRNSFMKKYGEHFGIEFKGLGNERFLFADNNVLGNSQGYFQMDLVEQYNKNNPNNPLVLIEYKTDGKSSSLIFTKKDGSSLDLSASRLSRGELGNGFYFNPDSGYIGKVGADGLVDTKSLSTGYWNGIGNMKTEATSDRFVDISVDFNRNSKGKATNSESFSIFTNSREEAYSPYSHPTGEKDESGNPINELKPGKVTFDSDGKLFKLHNVYKAPGEKGWGGYYGEDTYILHNKEDYDKKQGFNRVMVDLEKGEVFADVKRVEEGYGVTAKDYLKKTGEIIDEYQLNANQIQKEIEEGYQKLKEVREARETIDRLQKEYEKLGFLKSNNPLNPVVRDYKNAKFVISQGRYTIARKVIAEKLNLNPDSNLVKHLASEQGLYVLKNAISLGSSALGAGGDIKNWLEKRIGLIDSPVINNLNPVPESRLDIELSNKATRELKTVEMQSGRLYISDGSGNLVPIVERATTYGYVLPSKLNEERRYFDGIDFELYNPNYKEGGQRIKIISQNGDLGAIGVRNPQNMRSVNGKYQIDAGGGVSYHWDFLFWEGGNYEGSYETVLTADYQVNSDSYAKAKDFEKQANEEYRRLYDQRGDPDGDGVYSWTKKDIDELTEIYNNNYVRYNQILNSGDIEMSVSSNRLSEYLGSFSIGSENDNPIVKKINENTFANDKILQSIIAERGIGLSQAQIETHVQKEFENVLKFIQANPSNYLQLTKDSKNNLYQIRAGSSVYNIDTIAAPFIGNILPVLVGSGKKDENGKLSIDMEHSRFGNHIGINFYGGHYEGIRQSKRLQRSSGYVRQIIESNVRQLVEEAMKNPAYQVYNPYQCNRCR